MAKSRKMAGTADYIIPLGIIGLGVFVMYKLGLFSPSGAGSGLTTTLTTAASNVATSLGIQTPVSTVNQLANNISAQTWLNNYNQTRGQDCFTNALWLSNPAGAQLGAGDAQTLWALVHSQAGTWFSDGDFTGILAAFDNLVQNQTDISEVANIFQTQDSMDFFGYITQSNTFGNGMNPEGNNFQLVQQFVQWAIALPISGSES
jgi:hypothetical protein